MICIAKIMINQEVFRCFLSLSLRLRAQDDLKRATKLAFAQIKQFGMSKVIGLISFPADQQNPQNDDFGVKPYSKRLQRMMDEVITFNNNKKKENLQANTQQTDTTESIFKGKRFPRDLR